MVIVLLMSVGEAGAAWCQDAAATEPPEAEPAVQEHVPPPLPAHTGVGALLRNVASDFGNLPSRENLGWALFGGGLAGGAHALDGQVSRHFGAPGTGEFFVPGKILGLGYVQVAAALTTYATGRVTHRKRVSHIGMDLLRAQILAGAMTYGLKLTVRRERPNGQDNQSFPSGHAAVTFATALVLQRHFGWWSLPTILVASYTAASRIHENAHFLSDVVAGAAVGVIGGRTVTRHGRSSYALVPAFGPGRVALLVQLQR